MQHAANCLAGLPDHTVVLMDGLAYGVLDELGDPQQVNNLTA